MSATSDAHTWQDRDLIGSDGGKIGRVKELYEDARTGKPEWALVTSGLFGTRSHFEGRDALAGAEDRRETSGARTDEAMTRSEEELRAGTTQREAGRARLRKYVVTEQVNQTVPVRREKVRLEREPITEANGEGAMSGPEISEAEHEVVLNEEEVVVEKRVVPKERVRLGKETFTDEREVTENIRKEQIETEGADEIEMEERNDR